MRIGTSEIILILIVALLVLGPEKMPIYAKKVGKSLNSLKGYIGEFTNDINDNIIEPLEEAKKPLKDITDPLTNLSKTVQHPMDEITKSIKDIGKVKSKTVEDTLSKEKISEGSLNSEDSISPEIDTIDNHQLN